METTINDELAAFEQIREALESDHMGEWALIHNRELVSLFETFEQAAEAAVEKFGRGPFLIRQIGAPPVVLPSSILYRVPAAPAHGAASGQDKVRI